MILKRFFSNQFLRKGFNYFISYPLSSKASTSTSTKNSFTTVSTIDGIRRITLSNVKGRNVLSFESMQEILHHVTHEEDDPNLRCIVFGADGPVFSSGHNLKELNTLAGEKFHHKVFEICSQLMERMMQSPVPIIAAVDGLAAAAGCQLVAQCDIVICTENSSFSTPGAKFGIFCSTPGIAVARTVNRKVAAHMLFTGMSITSQEALQAGLVSKVVAKDNLEEELGQITTAIKSNSRSVITLGKRFFYKQLEKDIMSAYRLGSDVMVYNLGLVDAQEGIKAFIEKRKPNWGHTFHKT